MFSKIPCLIYFVLLAAIVTNLNGQQGLFEMDNIFPQCANSLTNEIKEQCLIFNCASQSFLFECKALSCKQNFPNATLEHKAFRLRCIKQICPGHQSHAVCTGLEECAKLKDQPLGRAKFILCISRLFPKEEESDGA